MDNKKVYWKMICSMGHENTPVENKASIRCCMNPDCGKPYDRKYDKLIPCDIDGNPIDDVKKTHETELIKTVDNNNSMECKEKNATSKDDGSGVTGKKEIFSIRRGRNVELFPNLNEIENVKKKSLTIDIQNSGKEVVLYSGGACYVVPRAGVIIGRSEEASNLFAINSLVSRKHAFIKPVGGGRVLVRDQDSLNGTYIDSDDGRRRITNDETVELKIGDKIWVANQLVVIGEKM